MNVSTLFLVSAAMLAGPWLLMRRLGPAPEIHGGLRILSGLNKIYCRLWHQLELVNAAPLPERGPAILIANHTCGIDHMLLQSGCERVLGFLIAKEYYDFWLIRPICRWIGCIPVKRNGNDLSATRTALRALEEGRVVPMFPEGRILPKSGREIGEGKHGVAFLAMHSRVPIIPAYICGTPETNDIVKGLLTPSKARVVFGPPIDLSDIPADASSDRATLTLITERLMGAIHALKDQSMPMPTPPSSAVASRAV
ncbi:lysophospholipid acyltransferase family protein [Singulisphaera rosea]